MSLFDSDSLGSDTLAFGSSRVEFGAHKALVAEQDASLLMTSNDYGVHVTVQQAKHLPKVCSTTSDNKSIPPNAYVLYRWYNQVSWHNRHSSLCAYVAAMTLVFVSSCSVSRRTRSAARLPLRGTIPACAPCRST